MICFYYLISLFLLIVYTTSTVNRVTLPDDDQIYLIELLQGTYKDITADDAKELVYELENFYTGVRDNLWDDCGPPYTIDKAFHLHIINTRLYAAFCDVIFGRFIHHSPFWSKHLPPDNLRERCSTQVQKLREYGVDVKYEHLWAPPTCGSATHNQLVTDKEHIDPYEMYCEL